MLEDIAVTLSFALTSTKEVRSRREEATLFELACPRVPTPTESKDEMLWLRPQSVEIISAMVLPSVSADRSFTQASYPQHPVPLTDSHRRGTNKVSVHLGASPEARRITAEVVICLKSSVNSLDSDD